MEVQRISQHAPASFSRRLDSITAGQELILKLLKNSIEKGIAITTDDIVDCYFRCVSKDGETVRVRGGFSSPYFFCNNVGKDNQQVRARAIYWFKTNLGSCIIKGRLLAIPIIDI